MPQLVTLTSLIGRRWYVCFRARVVATLLALVALGVAWRHADLLQERFYHYTGLPEPVAAYELSRNYISQLMQKFWKNF